jgi:integrase
LGKTNRSVELLSDVLLKTARYAGVLEPPEIKEVERLHAKLAVRITNWEKGKENKGERLLAQFNEPAVMDAFMALPHETVLMVAESGREGRMATYAIQRATILELWLAAPLRLSNLLGLRLDRHLFRAVIDGINWLIIRIPAEETKNGQALEYLLHDDAARLLEEYIVRWRPRIASEGSSYLFPGEDGGPKSKQVLATQMRKYIRRGCGVEFHPHLIRRLVAKLILDDEAGSLEIARRQLGHADTRMLLQVYSQRENRAMQKRYLQLLQSRRLSAIENLHSLKGRS